MAGSPVASLRPGRDMRILSSRRHLRIEDAQSAEPTDIHLLHNRAFRPLSMPRVKRENGACAPKPCRSERPQTACCVETDAGAACGTVCCGRLRDYTGHTRED